MKVLVLFSGGLDSTTCLALAIRQYGAENVIALSITYGQKHQKEIDCAERIVKRYGVKHIRLDAGEIFEGSNCTLLKTSTEEVPEGTYQEQQMQRPGEAVSTYVPFRNGLFLSMAASTALINGCGLVMYGAHMDDAAGNAYPDCTEAFSNAIGKAIEEGTGGEVRLFAPFITMNKATIVKLGLELGVPYELTWSCYNGGDKPCGRCGTCIDRARAFEANGVKDPAI